MLLNIFCKIIIFYFIFTIFKAFISLYYSNTNIYFVFYTALRNLIILFRAHICTSLKETFIILSVGTSYYSNYNKGVFFAMTSFFENLIQSKCTPVVVPYNYCHIFI